MKVKLEGIFLILALVFPTILQAQAIQDTTIPNIAVISFVGDRNVTAEQLSFLTGKFAAELMATKSFRILDRGKMDFILQEQGFQQSGACNSSECQVQMGQLLGVDAIVAGNLVRFGSKYAFRVDYIDVASGQVLYSSEVDESGELEDVYAVLCKNAAQELVGNVRGDSEMAKAPVGIFPPEADLDSKRLKEPPTTGLGNKEPRKPLSLKRKIAIALWGTSLVGGGAGYFFNTKISRYSDDYDIAYNAHNYKETTAAYDNGKSAETGRNVALGASIGSVVIGMVLWFLPEGK